MILHIFRKDVRLLWKYAAGVAIAGWLAVSTSLQLNTGPASIQRVCVVLLFIKVFATAVLIASVVHTDTVPGVRQDWLVRPIARRDLILAKLLFVLTMIVGADIIGDIAQLLFAGFSLTQALTAALTRAICLLAVFYLPVLGIAAITRNFTETVVAVAAALAVLFGFSQVIHATQVTNWQMSTTGFEWVVEFTIALIAALAGVGILFFQYAKRRTILARCLAACAGVLCLLVAVLAPLQPVFAIQQHFSPHLGGAAGVQLSFHPERPRSHNTTRETEPGREVRTRFELPICIDGLGADTILRTDLLQGTLTTPDGKTQFLDYGHAPLEMREGPARAASACSSAAIFIRSRLYPSLSKQTVRLDLDYSLTLLRLTAAHAMPALDGSQRIPEFGRCRTKLNEAGIAIALNCEQAAMTPPCATMFLEHPATGKRNPELVICEGPYTPFNTSTEPDSLRRLSIWLPFRDTAGTWHGPISDDQIRDSQVVTRWYDAVEHFHRHLVIPEVRLTDWL